MAALEAAVAAQARVGARAPRASARGSCAGRPRRCARRAEKLARILTAEMGKPLAESRAEVEFAADYLEWFAEEAVRISGRTQVAPDGRAPTWCCAPRSGRA